MSNICIHINTFTGLQIVPGKHIAVQLRDGSRMVMLSSYLLLNCHTFIQLFIIICILYCLFKIIENADLPLSKQDLKLENIN